MQAFNTIDAYSLYGNSYAESVTLPLCGDDAAAKADVLKLIQAMGFRGSDIGGSSQGSVIEAMPLVLFSRPTNVTFLITAVVFAWCFGYAGQR
jgi:predicted dinucleotide-binding enzyme